MSKMYSYILDVIVKFGVQNNMLIQFFLRQVENEQPDGTLSKQIRLDWHIVNQNCL